MKADLKTLRYFVAVAEAGSVSKAAQALYIAQPPLSVHIRKLEADIGTPLFVRESTGMRLTEAGSALFVRAREAVALAHEGFQAAQAISLGQRGRLIVGYMFSLGFAVLPRLVPMLRDAMPGVELEFVEMSASTCQAAIMEHKIVVGLTMPPIQDAEIVNTVVGSQPLRLAMNTRAPLARLKSIPMDKLQSARLIALPNLKVDSDTSIVATVLRRHHITMQIVARVETVHAALALVLAGEGYAIVPACAAVGGPQGVVFRKLAGVSEGFDVAVSRRRDAKSPFIEPFISVASRAVR